ncbi:hypothetical protein NPIL_101621 [Nephila pilipes]|uniref:Uncharacterized protein n=1 Tax=Nephila pilipes TaxID=299642 RepID=A0A8X6PVX0_NEPPI|nr:hypothetical protein NPIL_101621 [Nephila pilipes]
MCFIQLTKKGFPYRVDMQRFCSCRCQLQLSREGHRSISSLSSLNGKTGTLLGKPLQTNARVSSFTQSEVTFETDDRKLKRNTAVFYQLEPNPEIFLSAIDKVSPYVPIL